jgi:Short C-terminal domain
MFAIPTVPWRTLLRLTRAAGPAERRGMKLSRFAWLALPLALLAVPGRADVNPEIEALGHDTYALTHWARTGFTRNTDKLKAQALEDAKAYCAKLHKELKILSTSTDRPAIPLTGFASAKVVFKALDASDPELHAPVAAAAPDGMAPPAVEAAPARTATDALYSDILKLDDLRKRGLLTDEEFLAQKKKLLEKAN